MKNLFKILFVVVPMFLAGPLSAGTMTIVNVSGYTTNLFYNDPPENMNFFLVPPGTTKFDISFDFMSAWNALEYYPISQDGDYQDIFNPGILDYFSEVIPVSSADPSIQDAFNQGLYLSAVIVAVLLAFSIMRMIPGGGHEEI